ncbi:NTE family protein [Chitinivorax tropicus]|uniref:NTE family protein n=1 Tax=Chitinivorax tropicus TaxID=714531 RepID=A0A840MPQ8_9PROT|nr:patatin-like phospholipase family protein [Chitinivorax tropicus]MBB5018466.1 NTE family protein [Chitinivorax tropicus]
MRRFLLPVFLLALLSACTTLPDATAVDPTKIKPAEPVKTAKPYVKPKIALALGGGAAKGFAHIGVIRTLEANGIVPDIVVGTSAGSVVGALYAGGLSGNEMLSMVGQVNSDSIADFTFSTKGFIKGEELQSFVNRLLHNRPIEKLPKPFAAVATDLRTGRMVTFRQGNTGQAVRASSSVPGVFEPVIISGAEYVDGGLTSPVPVRAAKAMGADIVIAIDISAKPSNTKVNGMLDILLQTVNIMGQSISNYEMNDADVVIRPAVGRIGGADFDSKYEAVSAGEKAAVAALPYIRQKIGNWKG